MIVEEGDNVLYCMPTVGKLCHVTMTSYKATAAYDLLALIGGDKLAGVIRRVI